MLYVLTPVNEINAKLIFCDLLNKVTYWENQYIAFSYALNAVSNLKLFIDSI